MMNKCKTPGGQLEQSINHVRQALEATYEAFDRLYKLVQDLKRQQLAKQDEKAKFGKVTKYN